MSKLKKCLYIIHLLERKGPLSLNEINEWFRYSSLYDGVIQPRTFARYKEFIADTFPCYVEFNPNKGKYELMHQGNLYSEGDALYDYLLSAYHIEGMTELALKHRDRIMLMDAPNGVENVQTVLEAIDQQRGLECDYWSYNKQSKKHLTIIPYFLRTWEQRWYLVAEPLNHHHGQSVFALERMSGLWITKEKMLPSKQMTVGEYFEGCFGINHSDEPKPECIRIKVLGAQVNYVRALPIHESQQEVETANDWSIFEYHLEPCYNFYQQLLWHREKLEVLEPERVRNEMKEIVKKMLEAY